LHIEAALVVRSREVCNDSLFALALNHHKTDHIPLFTDLLVDSSSQYCAIVVSSDGLEMRDDSKKIKNKKI